VHQGTLSSRTICQTPSSHDTWTRSLLHVFFGRPRLGVLPIQLLTTALLCWNVGGWKKEQCDLPVETCILLQGDAINRLCLFAPQHRRTKIICSTVSKTSRQKTSFLFRHCATSGL